MPPLICKDHAGLRRRFYNHLRPYACRKVRGFGDNAISRSLGFAWDWWYAGSGADLVPFIDVNNGGSLRGALEALELTMKIAGPNTKLIPGHGTFINRTDIIPYRDMILAVQEKVRQMISQGKTQEEVLAAKVTAPYDAKVPGGLLPAGAGTSADRFVRMVYSQLKDGK